MERPSYLSKYLFDWELIGVMLDGRSAIDSKFFVSQVNNIEQANSFLKGYGLDPNDLVSKENSTSNLRKANFRRNEKNQTTCETTVSPPNFTP